MSVRQTRKLETLLASHSAAPQVAKNVKVKGASRKQKPSKRERAAKLRQGQEAKDLGLPSGQNDSIDESSEDFSEEISSGSEEEEAWGVISSAFGGLQLEEDGEDDGEEETEESFVCTDGMDNAPEHQREEGVNAETQKQITELAKGGESTAHAAKKLVKQPTQTNARSPHFIKSTAICSVDIDDQILDDLVRGIEGTSRSPCSLNESHPESQEMQTSENAKISPAGRILQSDWGAFDPKSELRRVFGPNVPDSSERNSSVGRVRGVRKKKLWFYPVSFNYDSCGIRHVCIILY